jgi:hypothetical protein
MWFWTRIDPRTGKRTKSSQLFHTAEACMADARQHGFPQKTPIARGADVGEM